jgi:protein gp37
MKQCRKYGVRFFFKQWGGVRKNQTGRLLDGRTYDEFPEAPSSLSSFQMDSELAPLSV